MRKKKADPALRALQMAVGLIAALVLLFLLGFLLKPRGPTGGKPFVPPGYVGPSGPPPSSTIK
jgi:hypothetical protein